MTASNGSINAYQKRLVHQLVRAQFPSLSSRGKRDFIQISIKNEESEKEFQNHKTTRFSREMLQAAGLRQIIDRIIEKKKVIVGHNCFQDLAYLYRTFLQDLPETLVEFCAILKTTFGMCVW